jgi:hypothetical protein
MSDSNAMTATLPLNFVSVNSLHAALGTLHDSRKMKGKRYQLANVLLLVIRAKLAGEDQMKGMTEWIRLREGQLLKLLGISRKRLQHQTTSGCWQAWMKRH